MSESGESGAEHVAVALARAVRAAGVPVPTGATLVLARALAETGLGSRALVFRAGRAVCCTDPGQFADYAAGFAAVFGASATETISVSTPAIAVSIGLDGDDGGPHAEGGSDGAALAVRWSRHEVLRARDFADYSVEELAEAHYLMERLRPVAATRRTRRLEPSRRTTRHPDLRRTARDALRTGGEPVRRSYRRPATKSRRIVLLLDVSGSMEPYARAYVRFIQAAVAGRSRVEAFAIGTRLTRITRELAGRDPDAAVTAAARRVVDWSGGTRLGAGLRQFNDEWGIRGLARGAVVVIVSDGWDRGEPTLLGAEMTRVSRVVHRLVWVNLLKATPGYAPLAGGMAAALPHIDAFVEGHSIDALERVVAEIGGGFDRGGVR